MKTKNAFINLLHFLLYIIVILIIVITCFIINDSFSGYRTKELSGSYVCFDSQEIYTFHDEYCEYINPRETYDFNYSISEGKVIIGSQEFIIYKSGILDSESNVFYEKVDLIYSLKNENE